MILVGNQRGGAKNLALHLLKPENDHVEVHELRGFASDNLTGALNESYAISRGTRCKQFLYSLSINPPPREQVSTADFEKTIERAETELGLTDQPRAIVFHEKEGRRHAHVVWSRIKVDEMRAVQLSHDRLKLTGLSRELYREHGFKMPRGLMRSSERDPRNFTLDEWQQAKRLNMKPPQIRTALEECWAVSDSRASFEHALQSRGFKLARGDRRGFVAVDMHGAPYSVPKYTGVRTKHVRDRLGELDQHYPSVEDRKREFADEIAGRLHELRQQEERKAEQERQRQEAQRKQLVERQRAERARQQAELLTRWERENTARQERFNRGWRKLLDHFTGRQQRIREQNIAERHQAVLRDRAAKDALIFRHMDERRALTERQRQDLHRAQERKRELETDFRRYASPVPSSRKPDSRGPPETSPDFAKASRAVGDSREREARREAFKEKWREQRNEGRSHGPER